MRRVLFGGRGAGEAGDARHEFRASVVRLVAVEDGRRLLDQLGEGAVRRARPVRGRAAAHRTCSLICDELRELEPQPRLSDAGGPNTVTNCAPALVDDALPDPGEHFELAVAPDHRHGCHRALADRCDVVRIASQPGWARSFPFATTGWAGRYSIEPFACS